MRIEWSWSARRRQLGSLFSLLAIAAFLATAARPSVAVAPASREGTLELLVDVSNSTVANDVAPTRAAAIQASTTRLIDRLPPQVQVGLIGFSGEVQALARPTGDRAAVKGQIAALQMGPATAIGDALVRALDELQTSRPAGPVWLLLISDGANTAGQDPLEPARLAGQRHMPILAVAVGKPDGIVEVNGQLIPVAPDPEQLRTIARESGGKALTARSAPELETALAELLLFAGLEGGQRDLTLLFAAATLLLLAIAIALRPAPRVSEPGPEPSPEPRRNGTARRWASTVVVLIVAGTAVITWTRWLPTDPTTPAGNAVPAAAATPPQVPPAAPAAVPDSTEPPPELMVDAATEADRTIVEHAAGLLRDHRLLASQRTAEIRRKHLVQISGLEVNACDVCDARSLTSSSTGDYWDDENTPCSVQLNLPFIKAQAKTAKLPLKHLVAMVLLHEQEVCMRTLGSRLLLFDAERRLAAQLDEPVLLDVVFAQIDARRRDWPVVEEAVAILRRHGELAHQRGDGLRRHHRNQVGPLQITVCRGCGGDDWIGEASIEDEFDGAVSCDIRLDLSGIEQGARDYGLPAVLLAASTLIHEQEHCVRDPDDRERPAVDAEHRLALELGNRRLLAWVQDGYSQLDSRGYWKS